MYFPNSLALVFLIATCFTLSCTSGTSEPNNSPNNVAIDDSSDITSNDVEAANGNAEPDQGLPDTAQADNTSNSAPLTPLTGEPMLFLADLGGPPYGNLPMVDPSPRLPSIEAFSEEDKQKYAGCLLAFYGVGYCYIPETRLLSAYLMGGDLFWSFNLPGDSGTNRVDALLATSALNVFANVTTEFGQPKHELSVFGSAGNFQGTFPLFELDGDVYPKVNIQGEPLAVGSEFQNASQNICINANTYELIDGGNPANPDDWYHWGAMYSQSSQSSKVDLVEGVLIKHPSNHNAVCRYTENYTNNSVRNNAQKTVENIYKEVTDADLHTAASALIRFANENKVINSQTPCTSTSPEVDSCNKLNQIGDTEKLETIEAECEVFSKYVYQYEPGTVELTTTMERVTEEDIQITQAFSFSDYCSSPNGYLLGTGSIVSTVDFNSRRIAEQVVHFENLTATLYNFVGGSYRFETINGTKTRTLQAESIGLLAYCTRSCHPGPFLNKTLQEPSIVDVREVDGARGIVASWNSIHNLEENNQNAVSLDLIHFGEDEFSGHIEYQHDNANVRAELATKAHYQNLKFFQYTLNETGQAESRWDVPVKGFPDSVFYSYKD